MLNFLKVLWKELTDTDVVKFKFWKSGELAWVEVVLVVAGAKVNLKFSYDGQSFAFYDGSVAPLDWDAMLRTFGDLIQKHEPVSDIGKNNVGNNKAHDLPFDEVTETVVQTSDGTIHVPFKMRSTNASIEDTVESWGPDPRGKI